MAKHFYAIQNLPKALPTKEIDELLTKFKIDKDENAKESLIDHNLRLVLHIAKKFENTDVDIEDLFSIGTIGLIKAVDTFNIAKNIRLATYASRCIENEMLMYLRKSRKSPKDVISMDEPLSIDSEGKSLTAADLISDPKDENDLYRLIDTQYASTSISIAFSSLTTKRLLAILYYLSGMKEKEVGHCIHISQSYVSRIVQNFFKHLKEIREYPEQKLKVEYSISQYYKLDFTFSIDEYRHLCLSCNSKFLELFLEFIKSYNEIKFETAKDTNRIIISLPLEESSSFRFYAQLIRYLTKY